MIDRVKVWTQYDNDLDFERVLNHSGLVKKSHQFNSISGEISTVEYSLGGVFRIKAIPNYRKIRIDGSWTKFKHGNNYSDLKMNEISDIVNWLSKFLHQPPEKIFLQYLECALIVEPLLPATSYLEKLISFKGTPAFFILPRSGNRPIEKIVSKGQYSFKLYDTSALNHLNSNLLKMELVIRKMEKLKLLNAHLLKSKNISIDNLSNDLFISNICSYMIGILRDMNKLSFLDCQSLSKREKEILALTNDPAWMRGDGIKSDAKKKRVAKLKQISTKITSTDIHWVALLQHYSNKAQQLLQADR